MFCFRGQMNWTIEVHSIVFTFRDDPGDRSPVFVNITRPLVDLTSKLPRTAEDESIETITVQVLFKSSSERVIDCYYLH